MRFHAISSIFYVFLDEVVLLRNLNLQFVCLISFLLVFISVF